MVKETGVKNIPDYISRKTKQWKDVHINIAIVGYYAKEVIAIDFNSF
jgi:hypothetical protein